PVTTSSTEFTQVIGGTTYNLGPISYVNAPGGGSLERGFVRQGFGLFRTEDRNRWETQARLQNIWGPHSFKYGFEYSRNNYKANATSTGIPQTFGNPEGLTFATPDNNQTLNTRITNNFSACTTRVIAGLNTIVCPAAAATARAALIAVAAGFPGGAITDRISAAEASANPFLVRLSTRVRDFQLRADTHTNVESFYMQDEFKLTRDIQLLGGLRWDFQQSYGNKGKTYLKLDKFWYNMQPRVGAIWDFTGRGRGKLFANYALFVETPIPLDVNVRAGSDNSQTDKNFNVNLVNAPPGSTIVTGIRGNPRTGAVNLGAEVTPIDPDLRPQTVHEVSAGVEYEIARNLAVGLRGIYRAQGSVIEDGSFDDGDTYFLFNPGQSLTDRIAGTREETGFQRFGRARRYYRAVEFTATKRFSQNYHFLASYVYSSLTGNYEGLFRNDNGQRDPNITSLFDLVSLLKNTYGRLPNDRPHQFKLNGGYTLPFNLTLNSSISAQSGIPINELIPHPVYGNNEGFGKPRGTVGRTNSTMTWDFGAYYPIKFGDNYQLRFQLDWFNVLNHQHAVRVDETFTLNSGVTGVPPISNPFYRNGTIFQFPSNVRLGVKLQF
ncbi:MAG: hypothetical protein HY232_00895, partial [Acidobacteria bacterium]|nr:hypothetical protein [Acidobacteriota bacterium]